MTSKKLSDLLESAKEEQGQTANLKAPTKEVPKKPVAEKRTDRLTSYVKASEKEAFIELIGRTSESDAVREVILRFIQEGKKL